MLNLKSPEAKPCGFLIPLLFALAFLGNSSARAAFSSSDLPPNLGLHAGCGHLFLELMDSLRSQASGAFPDLPLSLNRTPPTRTLQRLASLAQCSTEVLQQIFERTAQARLSRASQNLSQGRFRDTELLDDLGAWIMAQRLILLRAKTLPTHVNPKSLGIQTHARNLEALEQNAIENVLKHPALAPWLVVQGEREFDAERALDWAAIPTFPLSRWARENSDFVFNVFDDFQIVPRTLVVLNPTNGSLAAAFATEARRFVRQRDIEVLFRNLDRNLKNWNEPGRHQFWFHMKETHDLFLHRLNIWEKALDTMENSMAGKSSWSSATVEVTDLYRDIISLLENGLIDFVDVQGRRDFQPAPWLSRAAGVPTEKPWDSFPQWGLALWKRAHRAYWKAKWISFATATPLILRTEHTQIQTSLQDPAAFASSEWVDRLDLKDQWRSLDKAADMSFLAVEAQEYGDKIRQDRLLPCQVILESATTP